MNNRKVIIPIFSNSVSPGSHPSYEKNIWIPTRQPWNSKQYIRKKKITKIYDI